MAVTAPELGRERLFLVHAHSRCTFCSDGAWAVICDLVSEQNDVGGSQGID